MRFIDSYQFVARPLADLIQEMKNNNNLEETFPITACYFNAEKLDLVSEKGVYPYEYVDTFDKFEFNMPNKDAFDKNTLGLVELTSTEKYEFAQKVYSELICKNFG